MMKLLETAVKSSRLQLRDSGPACQRVDPRVKVDRAFHRAMSGVRKKLPLGC